MSPIDPRAAGPANVGAAVAVKNLVKHYRTVRAVDEVSFDVRPGEFLALLGPSGSGKTTILMMIAGFEVPTSGAVFIGGRDVTDVAPHRRELGMVFQRYALFPHMSVAENVAFPLKIRGVPSGQRLSRVEEALAMVRLSGLGDRHPDQLSGGQQQRVALARVIAYRPSLLLMDEPLGALDRKLREEMQIELKHIQRHLGTTLIYVTHDQDEALMLADRIAVLHEGRLQQIGPPTELYDQPANAFVADFIGQTNFFDGQVDAVEGAVASVEIQGGTLVKVQVPAPGTLRPGTRVRVGVRPEHVVLRPSADRPGGWPGVVEETLTRGAWATCVVRLAGDTVVTATVPRGDGAPGWQPGDRVDLSWERGRARLYARET